MIRGGSCWNKNKKRLYIWFHVNWYIMVFWWSACVKSKERWEPSFEKEKKNNSSGSRHIRWRNKCLYYGEWFLATKKTTDTVSIRIFFACTVFIWLFDYVVHRLARQHGGRKYSLSLPLLVWLLFPPHHRHTQKRATCARGQDLPFTKPFLGRGV